MRLPSFPFTPQNPSSTTPENQTNEKALERAQAIETLQARLKENKTMSPEIRTATMKALLQLLEKDITEGTGELVTNQEMFHYSEPPTAANDSKIPRDTQA